MTPQELKASILAMAFQGDLTAQYPFDSDIEQTINACKEDKKRAINEGKFRNEKFRGAIVDHEYNIPDSWRVLYISDIALFQEGPGILAVDFRATGIPLIRISGMQTNRVSLDGCNFLDPAMVENKWNHFKLDLGDILISTSASMDKVCEVFEDCVGSIPYTGQIRFKMYGGISKEYFKWFVQSPFYIKQIVDQQAGAAIKHYGPTHLKRMTIPIAPIEEQKRIVAKIEELLPLIDRYEKAWSRLEDFNKRFPMDMQKSILHMAIQGKLVPQLLEEGTGEELFQQIQAEKQALIKAGKIKKEKPLPEIAAEETPFDIPESWRWVRLGEIASINGGFAFKSTNYTTNGVRVIRISDFNELGFVDDKIVRHPYDESLCQYVLDEKNILLCMTGGTVGKSLFVTQVNETMVVNQRVATIKVETILSEYVYQVILAPITQKVIQHSKNSTNDNISMDTIKDFLIPLPPLAEQKRIVAKLEEILPLCERLK